MYQMAATMMAPMISTPKYPTCVAVDVQRCYYSLDVYDSLKSSSVGDDVEFPTLVLCRVLLRLLLVCFSSGTLGVPSFLIWMCFFLFPLVFCDLEYFVGYGMFGRWFQQSSSSD